MKAIFLLLLWCSQIFGAPADDEGIREDEILRRMEREIGLSLHESPARREEQKPPADPRLFPGRLLFSGGKELRAELLFSQKEIVLLAPTPRRIRILSAASIEFTRFRLVVGRYVPVQAVIVLKDGSRIQGEVRSEDWLSVPVQSAGVREELPLYFTARQGSAAAEEISAKDPEVPAGLPLRIEFQVSAEQAAVEHP